MSSHEWYCYVCAAWRTVLGMTTTETQPGWVPAADTFGARLALARNHLGLNIKKAAERSGVDPTSWNKWEKGRQPRDLVPTTQRIAAALGCDFLWLLTGRSGDDKATRWMFPWTAAADGRFLTSLCPAA